MLTIDKFEEASEVVKRVTQDTKLIFSDYFSQMTGIKYILSRKICREPVRTS